MPVIHVGMSPQAGGRCHGERAENEHPDQESCEEAAVDFDRAQFSGGEVSFNYAKFSGGTVDFSSARDWSVPPTFPWTDTPPPGVKLPEEDRPQM